jgi:transposase
MMIVPAGVKVHLALGYTDMRKGMDGPAMLVQDTLKKDAFSGHLFAFPGKRARIIKIPFWDGNGLCLRIDQGGFVSPRTAGAVRVQQCRTDDDAVLRISASSGLTSWAIRRP